MEGLALTGAGIDTEPGLLSTVMLEMGGSSDLCALLKPGEPGKWAAKYRATAIRKCRPWSQLPHS
jgi:hypothetical protein